MHDLALSMLGGLFGFFNLQSLQFYSISVGSLIFLLVKDGQCTPDFSDYCCELRVYYLLLIVLLRMGIIIFFFLRMNIFLKQDHLH